MNAFINVSKRSVKVEAQNIHVEKWKKSGSDGDVSDNGLMPLSSPVSPDKDSS